MQVCQYSTGTYKTTNLRMLQEVYGGHIGYLQLDTMPKAEGDTAQLVLQTATCIHLAARGKQW